MNFELIDHINNGVRNKELQLVAIQKNSKNEFEIKTEADFAINGLSFVKDMIDGNMSIYYSFYNTLLEPGKKYKIVEIKDEDDQSNSV